MIQIDYREVKGIPYAEVVDTALKDQVLPIVVFYHGWTSLSVAFVRFYQTNCYMETEVCV